MRPETLRFDSRPRRGRGQHLQLVVRLVYLGEVAQHLATIASTDAGAFLQLKAFELNPKIVARDDARQQARVWFSPDDVILLAAGLAPCSAT
ncbi:MAG: hypothetical protein U1F77_16535 [Kiritimatiellia bacterium]